MATGITWNPSGNFVVSSDYEGRLVWWDVRLSPEEASDSKGSLKAQLTGDKTTHDLIVINNEKKKLERKKYEQEIYRAGYDGSGYKNSRESSNRKREMPPQCSEPSEAIELIEINVKMILEMYEGHEDDEIIIQGRRQCFLWIEEFNSLDDSDPEEYLSELQKILDEIDFVRDEMARYLGTKAAGPLEAILTQYNVISRLFGENRSYPGMSANMDRARELLERANSLGAQDTDEMQSISEKMETIRSNMASIISDVQNRSGASPAAAAEQHVEHSKRQGGNQTQSVDKLKQPKEAFVPKYEDEASLLSSISLAYSRVALLVNNVDYKREFQEEAGEAKNIMKELQRVKDSREHIRQGDYMERLQELEAQLESLRDGMLKKVDVQQIAETTNEKFREIMLIANNSPENKEILQDLIKEARNTNKKLQRVIESKDSVEQGEYMEKMRNLGAQLENIRKRMIKMLGNASKTKTKSAIKLPGVPSMCLQCNKSISLASPPLFCLQCNKVISVPSLPSHVTWTGAPTGTAQDSTNLQSLKGKANVLRASIKGLFTKVKGLENIYREDAANAYSKSGATDSLEEVQKQLQILENIEMILNEIVNMDHQIESIWTRIKGTEYMEQKFKPSLTQAFETAKISKSLEVIREQVEVVKKIGKQVEQFSTEGLALEELVQRQRVLKAQGDDLMKRITYFAKGSQESTEKYQKPAEQNMEKIKKATALGEIKHFLSLMQGILDEMPKRKGLKLKWTNPLKEFVQDPNHTMYFVQKKEQWYELRVVCEENLYLERRWAEERELIEEEEAKNALDNAVSATATDQCILGSNMLSLAGTDEKNWIKTGMLGGQPNQKPAKKSGYFKNRGGDGVRATRDELMADLNEYEVPKDFKFSVESSIYKLNRILGETKTAEDEEFERNLDNEQLQSFRRWASDINKTTQQEAVNDALTRLEAFKEMIKEIEYNRKKTANQEEERKVEEDIETMYKYCQKRIAERPDFEFQNHPNNVQKLLKSFQRIKHKEAREGNSNYLEDIKEIQLKMNEEKSKVESIYWGSLTKEKMWREDMKESAKLALDFAEEMERKVQAMGSNNQEMGSDNQEKRNVISHAEKKIKKRYEEARKIDNIQYHSKLAQLVDEIEAFKKKIYQAAEALGLVEEEEKQKTYRKKSKKDSGAETSNASANVASNHNHVPKVKKYGPPVFTWEFTFLRSGPVGDSVRIAPIPQPTATDLSLSNSEQPHSQQLQTPFLSPDSVISLDAINCKGGNDWTPIFTGAPSGEDAMVGTNQDAVEQTSTTGRQSREQIAADRAGHLKEYVFRFCSSTNGGIYKYYESKRGSSLAYHHVLVKSTEPIKMVRVSNTSDLAKSQYQQELMSRRIEDDTEILDYEWDETPTCGSGEAYYNHTWNHVFHHNNPGLRTKMTTEPIEHVRRSHKGGRYAASCWNGRCVIYKPCSMERKAELDPPPGEGEDMLLLRGHLGAVTHACWSPDDEFVATCSVDHTVRIWNSRTGKQLLVMLGHAGFLRAVEWSPDGRYIASGGDDACMKIWDVSRWVESKGALQVEVVFEERKRQIHQFPDSLLSLAWHPKTDRVAVGWHGHEVEIFALEEHGWVKEMKLKEKKVTEMEKRWGFDKESKKNKQFEVPVTRITQDSKHIHAMQWSPTGQYLATAGGERHLRLWDARGENTSYVENIAPKQIWGLEWHPDSRQLKIAVVSAQGTVSVFDMGNARVNQIMIDLGVGKSRSGLSREERKGRYDAFAGKAEKVPHPNQFQEKRWDDVGVEEIQYEDETSDSDDEAQPNNNSETHPPANPNKEVMQKKPEEHQKRFLKAGKVKVYVPVMSSGLVYDVGDIVYVPFPTEKDFSSQNSAHLRETLSLNLAQIGTKGLGRMKLLANEHSIEVRSQLTGNHIRWSKPRRLGAFDSTEVEYFFTGHFAQDDNGITYLIAFNGDQNAYCEFAYDRYGGLLGERSGGKLEDARQGENLKTPVIPLHRKLFTDRTFLPSKLLYPPPVEQQYEYPMSLGQADGFGKDNTIFVKGITYVRYKAIKQHMEMIYKEHRHVRPMQISTWDARARYNQKRWEKSWNEPRHHYKGLRLLGHSDITIEGYIDSESGFMAVDDMKRQYFLFRDSGFKEDEFAEIVCQNFKIVGFRMPDANAFSVVNYKYPEKESLEVDRYMNVVHLDYWNDYPQTREEIEEMDRENQIQQWKKRDQKVIDNTDWEEKDRKMKPMLDDLNEEVRQRIEEYERRRLGGALSREENQLIPEERGGQGRGRGGRGRGGRGGGRGRGGGGRGRGGGGNNNRQSSVAF